MNQLPEMQAPPEWAKLGRRMHQDFLVEYPDFVGGFAALTRTFSADERRRLLDYLRYLSSTDLPGGEHKRRWDELGTDFSIRPSGKQTWRDFYHSILAAIQGDVRR
jgi:hypothetical protein